MNKKLIPAFVLAAAGLLASCGETKMTADVFIYQYSDTYIGTVRDALKTDLEAKGIKANFYDGAGNGATQVQQIETAIGAGANILLANLVEQQANGVNIAKKATDAGIPAVFFNREVPDAAVTGNDHCFVGTDPDQAGYMQGDIIASGLIKDGKLNTAWDKNGDGQISYVMLRADESNPEANGRTQYSVEQANKKLKEAGLKPLVQLGKNFNAEWNKDKAKAAMDNFISSHGIADAGKDGIELVIANNDDMALGAIASLQTHEYNKGAEKQIMVVGVDATDAAKEAINAGTMFGTVMQDAKAMSKCIAEITANKLNGKDYLEGTTYKWDSETVHKIRIPYGMYTKA